MQLNFILARMTHPNNGTRECVPVSLRKNEGRVNKIFL